MIVTQIVRRNLSGFLFIELYKGFLKSKFWKKKGVVVLLAKECGVAHASTRTERRPHP